MVNMRKYSCSELARKLLLRCNGDRVQSENQYDYVQNDTAHTLFVCQQCANQYTVSLRWRSRNFAEWSLWEKTLPKWLKRYRCVAYLSVAFIVDSRNLNFLPPHRKWLRCRSWCFVNKMLVAGRFYFSSPFSPCLRASYRWQRCSQQKKLIPLFLITPWKTKNQTRKGFRIVMKNVPLQYQCLVEDKQDDYTCIDTTVSIFQWLLYFQLVLFVLQEVPFECYPTPPFLAFLPPSSR